jgi:ABC-type bacteriocin/lantibiotic exporter with double-glycine peptidase domain
MVAVLSLGGLRVINGEMTLGTLVAIMALMTSFIGPLNSLMGLFEHIQHAIGDLNRLSDLMSKTDAEQANEKAAGIPGALAAPAILLSPLLSGRLELRDLSFGYSRTDPPLIRDFSLSLEPGMRVALVGGSGSGKSTIGRMVAGLLQPWSGDVMFDGTPRSAIPPRALASSVSYVDQDVFLFEGTIRENLTLWDPTVPETNIVEALKDAEIHADVTARAGRYDAMVTEGGLNFSGGQRQRLEIARALVPCPSILILDEATAALDPITEQRIDQAIRRRGCTCLIIAHRLSAIRDADEIIVLRKGVIVERGDHDTLLAAGNIYASLIQAEA